MNKGWDLLVKEPHGIDEFTRSSDQIFIIFMIDLKNIDL